MKKKITKQIVETSKLKIKISTDGVGIDNPYFSITAELLETNERDRWETVACGCLHDEILEVAPELKPLVDIHLSDLDGVPMHAFENGWYWLAKACGIKQVYQPDQSEEECFEIFMKHCRIDYSTAREIVEVVIADYKETDKKTAKSRWYTICESFKPVWKKQAEEAIQLIESIQE